MEKHWRNHKRFSKEKQWDETMLKRSIFSLVKTKVIQWGKTMENSIVFPPGENEGKTLGKTLGETMRIRA